MRTTVKFAEILGDLLFEKNLNGKEFAKEINVDATCITRYLSGKRKPSIENLVLIADYFKCSTDYLLGFEEKQNLVFNSCPQFCEWFAAILNERKYNCLKLSKQLDEIQLSSLYDWKSGRRKPTIDSVLKLADKFDCRIDFILGRET